MNGKVKIIVETDTHIVTEEFDFFQSYEVSHQNDFVTCADNLRRMQRTGNTEYKFEGVVTDTIKCKVKEKTKK